jgi:hypothetical protein
MAAHRNRFGTVLEMLRQRVAAEPGVVGVTFVDKLPRTHYADRRIALDDSAAVAGPSGATRSSAAGAPEGLPPRHYTTIAFVDPSYFDVLEAPIRAGRGFQAADLAADARVAIVDQGFVDEVLQGRNAIGRRVRIADGPTARAPTRSPGTRSWAS